MRTGDRRPDTHAPALGALLDRPTRYVFSSHDGYGLGHVRRNSLIAAAVLRRDPTAEVVLVTGVGEQLRWLRGDDRIRVVRVPPLLKGSSGEYVSGSLPFDQAIAERARIFDDEIRRSSPDVVVVDRHPYGTSGELRPGLERAREDGAAVV